MSRIFTIAKERLWQGISIMQRLFDLTPKRCFGIIFQRPVANGTTQQREGGKVIDLSSFPDDTFVRLMVTSSL